MLVGEAADGKANKIGCAPQTFAEWVKRDGFNGGASGLTRAPSSQVRCAALVQTLAAANRMPLRDGRKRLKPRRGAAPPPKRSVTPVAGP